MNKNPTDIRRASRTLLRACAFMGSVYVLLGIPLVLGLVPPNGVYGIRLPAAFASAHHWALMNHAGGGLLIVLGVVLCALALSSRRTLMRSAPSEETRAAQSVFASCLFAIFGAPVILIVVMAIYGNALK